MIKKVIKVKLDINKHHLVAVSQTKELYRNDVGNLFIEAEVYNNGMPVDLTEYTAIIRYTDDINKSYKGFGDTLCEIAGHIIIAEVFGAALKTPGKLIAQITLTHDDKQQITLQPFYMYVRDVIDSSETYDIDETMPIIQQMRRRIEELEAATAEGAGVVVTDKR